MNIPPKYEDVVAKLDAALAREAALREELAALRESYEAMRDRKNSIVDLQQRLTVAEDDLKTFKNVYVAALEREAGLRCVLMSTEQRADDMAHALTVADEYLCAAESLLDRGEDDSFNLEPAIIAVRDALKAAIKPAAEGEAS